MKYTWPMMLPDCGARGPSPRQRPWPFSPPTGALGKQGRGQIKEWAGGLEKGKAKKQRREAAALRGAACTFDLKSRSSATASKWKDYKPYTSSRPAALSVLTSIPLAVAVAALAMAATTGDLQVQRLRHPPPYPLPVLYQISCLKIF